jgi:hypothetical protein
VGIGDQADFYSFTLSGRSSFNLSLNKLKNNVDVFLQQGKQVIGRSTKGGKKPESISTTLEAGTYFVRVQQKSGNSKYRLTLNATSSDNGGGNPPPPSSPGQFRYLVQQFGVGGSRILKLNTASGVTSILAEDNNSLMVLPLFSARDSIELIRIREKLALWGIPRSIRALFLTLRLG